MISILEHISFFHWLIFGFFLLTLELLITGGYFLWLGLSALLVGIALTVKNISWELQVITIVAFLLFSLLYAIKLRKKRNTTSTSTLSNNDLIPGNMLGKTIKLNKSVLPGEFQIEVQNSHWTAKTAEPILAGSIVTITDIEGLTLIVSTTH